MSLINLLQYCVEDSENTAFEDSVLNKCLPRLTYFK